MIFPLPYWIKRMPEGAERRIATKRFFLRLSAIYATPGGHIYGVAKTLEIHPKTLISQMSSLIAMSEDTYDGISRILSPAELPELNEIKRIRG